MENTVDKIHKLSQRAAKQQVAEQSKAIQERVKKDTEVLENILEMVADRLVYKEIKSGNGCVSYVVVTEEIVLQDFTSTPENSWNRGTSIEQIQADYYTYKHTRITVNGNRYHHAADLIEKYKHDARTAMNKAEVVYDATRARVDALDAMTDLEPVMKELMLNYNKHLGVDDGQGAKE